MTRQTFEIKPPEHATYQGERGWLFVSFDLNVEFRVVDGERHLVFDDRDAWCTLTKGDDFGLPTGKSVKVRLNDPDWVK